MSIGDFEVDVLRGCRSENGCDLIYLPLPTAGSHLALIAENNMRNKADGEH